jgi:acetylornithine deacetylase
MHQQPLTSHEEMEGLALRFLEVESVTGNEAAYAAMVAEVLEGLGLAVQRQVVAPGRENVIADGRGARLLFCTHLDTVPPWFPPREDADHLYGRGACDTKGILAAMICAGQRLRARGIVGFGYLLVVGEEVDGIGAQAADGVFTAEHVVVGEPTQNKLVAGHKGVVKVRLRAHGVAGHSAYPDSGRSAVHLLVETLHGMRKADLGRDGLLGEATLNVGRIEGGWAANVIADAASAEVMVRTVTEPGPVLARLEALCGEHVAMEVLSAKAPSRMKVLPGFETDVVGFSTDIPHLQRSGTPLLYGPGSILDAHTAGERIARASLRRAVDDYVRMAELLLGTASAS